MRREVRNLVFLHAFMRLRSPKPSHRYRDGRLKGHGLGRAVIGSRLRRIVRDAGLVELIALLHAPEAQIAKLVRRLRKGLTRRRRVRFAPVSVLAPTIAPCAVASADTS